MTRRTLVAATACLALPAAAQSDPDDAFPALPQAQLAMNDRPDFLPSPTLGLTPPPEIDVRTARAILERAPFNCAPIDVAMYFRNIGQGQIPDLGSVELQARAGAHFVRGWPTVYNPVIIEFFRATRTDPLELSGDGTHWCAAFVNWCIARGRGQSGTLRTFSESELAFGTRNASSGSFRCWRTEAVAPQQGDVVVWAVEGTVNGCSRGAGHVAFYWGPGDGDRIQVVGGNQRDPTTIEGATQSAVNRKTIPRSFPVGSQRKTFHSFRSVAA